MNAEWGNAPWPRIASNKDLACVSVVVKFLFVCLFT